MAAVVGAVPAGADVDAAASAIAGRGPDGMATWTEEGLLLVASRLAHWDEGAPRQPWLGPNGEAAAFNGELFNLAELQELLGRPGASEIEVLVVGLREIGPEFLRHIDGQFAGVIRVAADGPIYAIRDRFGIAPLYWAELPGGVALGSNLRAVLALRGAGADGLDAEFDMDGLAAILADWAPTGSLSPYVGVHQVRPGHVLSITNAGDCTESRWAATAAKHPPLSGPDTVISPTALQIRTDSDHAGSPTGAFPTSTDSDRPGSPTTGRSTSTDSDHAGPKPTPTAVASTRSCAPDVMTDTDLDELEAALRHAVGVRLRSTGKVACLLSGGIDSTIIGALAAEQGATLGLALCLEGDDVVAQRQRQVADTLGMDLIQHILTPAETVELFEAYTRTRRVPLVRLGPVGMTALARRARAEGIRAVLSGEGADELFAGYDSYRILAARGGLFGPVKNLPWAEFGTPEFGADRGPTWARSYWRGLVQFSKDAGARRLDILRPVADLVRSPLREVITGRLRTPGVDDADSADATGAEPTLDDVLEARRRVDLRALLAGYLLTVQGDHAWMEEGVELRPPYLATPVAEWALARPVSQFLAVGNGKLPVRALLPRLADRRPALADLGFAKAAFRVDANFLLRDADAFARFTAPARRRDHLVETTALSDLIENIQAAGTCSEAESMLLTFAGYAR